MVGLKWHLKKLPSIWVCPQLTKFVKTTQYLLKRNEKGKPTGIRPIATSAGRKHAYIMVAPLRCAAALIFNQAVSY